MTASGGGATPQTQRGAAETRTRLLLAARSLFAVNGYANVGIRDIATKAGVNPALINRYFGSKRRLFEEVADALGEEGKNLGDGRSPIARAVEAMNEIIDNGEKSLRAASFRFTALSALDPDVSDVIARAYDKIRQQLIDALPGGRKATRAELVLSLFMGASMVRNLLRTDASPRVDAEYMKKNYARLLAALYADAADEDADAPVADGESREPRSRG